MNKFTKLAVINTAHLFCKALLIIIQGSKGPHNQFDGQIQSLLVLLSLIHILSRFVYEKL